MAAVHGSAQDRAAGVNGALRLAWAPQEGKPGIETTGRVLGVSTVDSKPLEK